MEKTTALEKRITSELPSPTFIVGWLMLNDLVLEAVFWGVLVHGLSGAALSRLRAIRPRRAIAVALVAGVTVALAAPAAIQSNNEKLAAAQLASLAGTLKAIYPGDERPLDPWGNAYRYERTGDGFRILSAGPDGKFNTRDDLVEHVTLPFHPLKPNYNE